MRLEMRWRVNEAEIYKIFFSPEVSWILLLMIPYHSEGFDRKRHIMIKEVQGWTQSPTWLLSAQCFLDTAPAPSLLHLSITGTEKESAIMFKYLIQREQGIPLSPRFPQNKKIINAETADKVLCSNSILRCLQVCFNFHHCSAII